MNFRVCLLIYFVSLITACALLNKRNSIVVKEAPEYTGVDAQLQPYVDEFFILTSGKQITFTEKVSVGFKNIKHGRTIGLCTYSHNFREIDIDSEYFMEASLYSRKALIFHELAHCYCERDHDFGEGQNYPETILGIITENIKNNIPPLIARPQGYFDDFCPLSLMHPTIPSDWCLYQHFAYYQQEMLERCKPF